MTDYGGLAAIMAQQRSGTHMLGAAIGSHPDMKYAGEIFCRRVPATAERMWELVRRVKCGGFAVVCLDVKYNQISPPVEELLERIPVVHLVRRDADRLYYSGELHDLYNRNPAAKREGVTPRFEIVPERYESIVWARDRCIARYGHLETVRLHYEDLTQNREIDRLPEWASRDVCRALGVPHRTLTVGTKKMAPPDSGEFLRD